MFCDHCGKPIPPGASFCQACGRSLSASPATAAGGRVAKHVRLLGILWIAYSFLHLLGGGVLMIMANTVFGRMGHAEVDAPAFLQPMLSFIGLLVLAKAAAGLAAGWGLLERQSWARVLALIVGVISLLNLPFGTALGIFTIWVLLSPKAAEQYQALPRSA